MPKGIDSVGGPGPRSSGGHPPPPPRKSFRALYCEAAGIRRERFARHLFFRCLRGWVYPVVAVQYFVRRRALENDFRLIGEVAEVTTYREFMGALETFTYRNRESGFFREVMRIRMSAKLLMKFGSRLLRHTDREVLHEEKEIYAALKPGGQPNRVPRRSARRF